MKKYAAPLISAVSIMIVIAAFGTLYYYIFKDVPGAGFVRIIFGIGTVGGVVVLVIVLVMRLKEIKRGEEDDLGKY